MPEPWAAGAKNRQTHAAITESPICMAVMTNHPRKYEYLHSAPHYRKLLCLMVAAHKHCKYLQNGKG